MRGKFISWVGSKSVVIHRNKLSIRKKIGGTGDEHIQILNHAINLEGTQRTYAIHYALMPMQRHIINGIKWKT